MLDKDIESSLLTNNVLSNYFDLSDELEKEIPTVSLYDQFVYWLDTTRY